PSARSWSCPARLHPRSCNHVGRAAPGRADRGRQRPRSPSLHRERLRPDQGLSLTDAAPWPGAAVMTAALVGLICVAASGVILVTLHFLPTGLDPIRYAVSDYGWTPYTLGSRDGRAPGGRRDPDRNRARAADRCDVPRLAVRLRRRAAAHRRVHD